MKRKFVSWRRVSTKKQGASGLGLEAQKEIIRYFIERDGGKWVADYAECYTGTELSGCVELQKAIAHAKKEGAVLIIAKSDRFRNTVEALQVYEQMGDGNIMFCDLPHTDKFTLTLFFALAEREALLVSIRTKQALAAKKARGEKMGAASEKYKASQASKTQEQLKAEDAKKGETKRQRYHGSRDVKMFLMVLKNTFPSATKSDEPSKWNWGMVNTKGDNKTVILSRMKEYTALNSELFQGWNFSDERAATIKLRGYIDTLKKSFNKTL